jgi:hypothetical protein
MNLLLILLDQYLLWPWRRYEITFKKEKRYLIGNVMINLDCQMDWLEKHLGDE